MEGGFSGMEAALRIDLIPNGGLQEIIFERIIECAWNLERCRHVQAQLFDKTAADFSIDPLLDDQNEAKLARIDKYARQYENSMFKAMRELSKIQTEAQCGNEIHPLTKKELDTPELFEQTPQSLSAICDFQKVLAASRLDKKTQFQIKAESDRAGLAFLERITAPPTRRREMSGDPGAGIRSDAA